MTHFHFFGTLLRPIFNFFISIILFSKVNQKSVIDYMVIERDHRQKVRDTRVFRGFTFGSDHFFVGSRLSVGKLDQTKGKKVVSRKFRVGRLKDEAVRALFETKFAEKFEGLPGRYSGRILRNSS